MFWWKVAAYLFLCTWNWAERELNSSIDFIIMIMLNWIFATLKINVYHDHDIALHTIMYYVVIEKKIHKRCSVPYNDFWYKDCYCCTFDAVLRPLKLHHFVISPQPLCMDLHNKYILYFYMLNASKYNLGIWVIFCCTYTLGGLNFEILLDIKELRFWMWVRDLFVCRKKCVIGNSKCFFSRMERLIVCL